MFAHWLLGFCCWQTQRRQWHHSLPSDWSFSCSTPSVNWHHSHRQYVFHPSFSFRVFPTRGTGKQWTGMKSGSATWDCQLQYSYTFSLIKLHNCRRLHNFCYLQAFMLEPVWTALLTFIVLCKLFFLPEAKYKKAIMLFLEQLASQMITACRGRSVFT